MNWLSEHLNDHAYAWVIPVGIVVPILFAMATGFYKGWKSSLFYLVCDFIALVIGVFTAGPLLHEILKTAVHSNGDVDFAKFANEHPAIIPILLLVWLPVLRIVSFFIHLIFRKKLRNSLRVNKLTRKTENYITRTTDDVKTQELVVRVKNAKYGKNLKARLGGVVISGVGAIPYAFIVANAVTVFSGSTAASPVVDAMITASTFGQYEGISKYVKDLQDFSKTIDKGGDKVIEAIFTGDTSKPEFTQNIKANHDTIQDILNSNSIEPLMKSLTSKVVDVSKIKAELAKGLSALPSDEQFKISQSKFDAIKSILTHEHNWSLTSDEWNKIHAAYFKAN